MATRTRRASALILLLFAIAPAAAAGILDRLDQIAATRPLAAQREFLPPDDAFVLSHETDADGSLIVHWQVAPRYYLYRDKIAVTAMTPGLALGGPELPAGEMKDDPEFGPVPILRDSVRARVPVLVQPPDAVAAEITLSYQGCAEDGICYPPIRKTLAFTVPTAGAGDAGVAAAGGAAPAAGLSAGERIAAAVAERSFALTLVSFLAFGLLLSLTPCVLPMVPILSGIIVGQQQPVTVRRGLALSSVYVAAMALTYALAGVAAGLLGQNLQAAFQRPAVIVAFSLLFVLLALSMFGFYELQIPAAVQSRLDRLSRSQRSGSYAGVAVMGVLSAVIVGPCVAPPLAGALAYISQDGSPVVGGSALFALGLGMGLPLIALGASAGTLLPRAGAWMEAVRKAFGLVFLAVAISFLARILPGPAVLALWALLAIGAAVFMGALDTLERSAGMRQRLGKGFGLALLVYGVVLIVGATAGGDDPAFPLAPLVRQGPVDAGAPAFKPVKSLAGLTRELALARERGRVVMLDVYADWCIECKHLERRTFADATVQPRLAELVLLRADVTANDAQDQALLRHYGLFGPPAVLFFAGDRELREERLIGFADAATFGGYLDRVAAAAR
jgi:thiol:disulfide interchange protein DsbD